MNVLHGFAALNGRPAFILAALLVPFAASWSQPFGLDPEAPDPVLIEFRAEPKLGEFVGRAEGTVDATGKRFYLKDLNVMAPLVLQVLAKDPARPVEVSLHRLLWEDVEWAGRTDADGNWGYVGRVYQDVGIQLKAEDNAGFYVLAWQGPAVKPKFGLTAISPAAGGGAGPADDEADGGGFITYAIIASAILALIVFGWNRRRQGNATAVAALVAVLFMLEVSGGPATAQVTVVDSDGLAERLLLAEQRISVMNDSLLIAMKDLESTTDMAFQNFDRIVENWEEIMQLGIQHQEFAAQMQSQVDALRADMQRKDRRHDRMIAELRTLIEEDREAEPDPTVGGSLLTSSCDAETEEEVRKCGKCFVDVNKRLAERLEYMETARIQYDTAKSMVQNSIMAGDARSGYHQLEQAEWFKQRQKMHKSLNSVKASYDQYLVRAYADLHRILKHFGICEREAGGSDVWWEREGQLFYTILKARYDRND